MRALIIVLLKYLGKPIFNNSFTSTVYDMTALQQVFSSDRGYSSKNVDMDYHVSSVK